MNQYVNFSKERLIVKRIKSQTVTITKLLKTIPHYLSGSYLMNAVFSPMQEHGDIDVYFPKKKNYNAALKVLLNVKKAKLLYQTQYASTFIIDNKVFQLVKNAVKNIFNLANQHDFSNCCLAFNCLTDFLHITPQAKTAWSKNALLLNKSPLTNTAYPAPLFLNQLNLLYLRIIKYTQRYRLALSKDFKLVLKSLCSLAKKHLTLYQKKEYLYDYAGTRIVCLLSKESLLKKLEAVQHEDYLFKL